eukprot:403338330
MILQKILKQTLELHSINQRTQKNLLYQTEPEKEQDQNETKVDDIDPKNTTTDPSDQNQTDVDPIPVPDPIPTQTPAPTESPPQPTQAPVTKTPEEQDLNKCQDLLQNLTSFFQANGETIENIIRNSGKDYNDFGRYEDCLNITGYRYILASVPKAFPIPMSIGLCIPDACEVSDFNNYKPYLIELLNQILPEVFEGIKGFNIYLTLVEHDLIFEDSEQKNHEITKATSFSWFIIMIVFFLILTVIISSFAQWYFKRENKRFQLEQQNLLKEEEQQEKKTKKKSKKIDRSSPKSQEQLIEKERKKKIKAEVALKKRIEQKQKAFQDVTTMEKVIKCFSMQNSLKILFSSRSNLQHREFEVLNGIRVLALNSIILGNTFFYILKGPLQNMNEIQEFLTEFLFSFVLAADFVVDIFFWMTAFIVSYFMLVRLRDNLGNFGGLLATLKLIIDRAMRLLPAYIFALFFFWKFLVLFGGDGPMFFMYQTMTDCGRHWIFHFMFLNNIIPWNRDDNCMPWTWYIANDFQFYLLLPLLTSFYFNRRKTFYYTISGAFAVCKLIQMIVILVNDLSASYFTYNDEYWTEYYVKPYTRLPVFLIGVMMGCSYYSFRYEDPKSQFLARLFKVLQTSRIKAIICTVIGSIIGLLMIIIMQVINNAPNNGSLAANLFYLLLSRPLFILGFSTFAMPLILGNPSFKTLKNFLSHSFWIPFSRLTYGAFLTHGIFMQFREYNSERGQWACAYDAILFFIAYVSFSYLFAFLMALVVELPIASIYKEFTMTKQQKISQNVEESYYNQTNDEESRIRSKIDRESSKNSLKKEKKKSKSKKNKKSINVDEDEDLF